jgi:hypothetical protein
MAYRVQDQDLRAVQDVCCNHYLAYLFIRQRRMEGSLWWLKRCMVILAFV